jgi:hypothetical protein
MAKPDFAMFDADNHYYEATDAFTRHVAKDMQKRCMQWAELGRKTRLLVGGEVNNFIPNPTFDPIAKPRSLQAFFKGQDKSGQDLKALFGELEPIRPEYRDRDARRRGNSPGDAGQLRGADTAAGFPLKRPLGPGRVKSHVQYVAEQAIDEGL